MPKQPMNEKALTPAEKQRRYRAKKKLEGGSDGVALWLKGEHTKAIYAIAKIMGISQTKAAGVIFQIGLKEFNALTTENAHALHEVAFPSTGDPDDLAALKTARESLRICFRQQATLLGIKL